MDTVKVKHPDGYMIINKDDFNPKTHELYVKGAAQPKKSQAELEAAAKEAQEKAAKEKAEADAAASAVETAEEVAAREKAEADAAEAAAKKALEDANKPKELEDMSKKELAAFAEANDIGLKNGLTQAQMVGAIQAALEAKAGVA